MSGHGGYQGDELLPQEMTILDWIKARLRGQQIALPELAERVEVRPAAPRPERGYRQVAAAAVPELPVIRARHLRTPVGLILALMAQLGLAARAGPPLLHVAVYLAGAALLLWAYRSRDFALGGVLVQEKGVLTVRVRTQWLLAGLVFGALTFYFARNNQFNPPTVLFWLASIVCVLAAFWDGGFRLPDWRAWALPRLEWKVEGHHLLLVALVLVALWFRAVDLEAVPFEMWSDQAEKLFDVQDVLDGSYPVFFTRNTGREPLQFYLAAATARLLGTGISFMTLKIGTVLAGLLTLPFLYLYAREVGGRVAAITALGLAGISSWANIISRVGLRFPFLALFTAPALFYLVRGLRRGKRNDLLLSGAAVGIGLNGYSPARILPLVVAFGIVVYVLHRESRADRAQALTMLMVVGLVSLTFVLPLAGYTSVEPDAVMFRMMSRMGEAERSFPGSPVILFLGNLVDSLAFFGWDNGGLWVVSVPNRPVLDWVTGALFHVGVILLAVRYVRKRDWVDLFTLLSIPILMLPSTLSIAFPIENPAPHRASGAMIPALALAGLTGSAAFSWVRRTISDRRMQFVLASAAGVLFVAAGSANYRITFDQWNQRMSQSSWNTVAAGQVVKGFASSIGDWRNAYVVPYPHWMDTRLVGITAGFPGQDFALQPPFIPDLGELTEPHLFLVHPDDLASAETLESLYPAGRWQRYVSPLEGKDFLIFFVPGADRVGPQDLGGALP